jgi:sterol desaturase/sphingolipid hydroxylase (fatty acid hydroxylase superfamily)
MNKLKLFVVSLVTAVIAIATSLGLAFTQVRCTEVSMLTSRDPMGPIWFYKQLMALCGFGPILVVVIGLALIGLLWFFAYRKNLKDLKGL